MAISMENPCCKQGNDRVGYVVRDSQIPIFVSLHYSSLFSVLTLLILLNIFFLSLFLTTYSSTSTKMSSALEKTFWRATNRPFPSKAIKIKNKKFVKKNIYVVCWIKLRRVIGPIWARNIFINKCYYPASKKGQPIPKTYGFKPILKVSLAAIKYNKEVLNYVKAICNNDFRWRDCACFYWWVFCW